MNVLDLIIVVGSSVAVVVSNITAVIRQIKHCLFRHIKIGLL